MNIYQNIIEYNEPIEVLSKICRAEGGDEGDRGALMSQSELGFLCGLLKKYRPKKIVEVGVYSGGTSAVLLNCIQMLNLETEMYSIDLAENIKITSEGKTPIGYLISEAAKQGINTNKHTLLLGKVIASRLEQIGNEIDFVILDTTHTMPGEVLDFLAIFPYLKKGAVVVLHDVADHLIHLGKYATSVLFHSVVADKIINNQTRYPNIAAFQVNEDTKKYILNVFEGLIMPWEYLPNESDLKDYEKIIKEKYPQEHQKLYYQAKNEMQRIVNAKKEKVELRWLFELNTWNKVLLYGAGEIGFNTLKYLQKNNIKVHGFIVSDGWKISEEMEGLPIYEFSTIPYNKEEVLILLTSSIQEPLQNLQKSSYKWVKVDFFEAWTNSI